MTSDRSASSVVSSTRSRINDYLIAIDADPTSTCRVTEAQLRWAHFQRAEMVRETKARIDKLMKHPRNVSDVEGALQSDGDASVNDEIDEHEVESMQSPTSIPYRATPQHSSDAKAYLGMRRDGQGRWVRRNVSQKRFPHLAKSRPHSSTESWIQSEQFASKQAETCKKKKKRVEISRGRRALLRVSARALEERKKQSSSISTSSTPTKESSPVQSIQISPSPRGRQVDENIDEVATVTDRQKKKKKTKLKVVFENVTDLESIKLIRNEHKVLTSTFEDEISGLFTARTGESNRIGCGNNCKSYRRRRPGSSLTSFMSNDDEERIRRFEEAYNSIMLASDPYHESDEVTVSSEWMNSGGKRWTRDPNISSAVSIDGRSYDDLQRTPTASMKQMQTSPDCYDHKYGFFRSHLHDRAATWLVHVPKPTNKHTNLDAEQNVPPLDVESPRGRGRIRGSDTRNALLSPCQKKLSDIEHIIQRSERNPKFDLSQNRMAIAQTPIREKCTERAQYSTSYPQRNHDHVGTAHRNQTAVAKHDATLQPHHGSSSKNEPSSPHIHPQSKFTDRSFLQHEFAESSCVNTRSNDSKFDKPKSVRPSTLRLLFHGISDKTSPTPANILPTKGDPLKVELTSRERKASVTRMRAMFEHSVRDIHQTPRSMSVVPTSEKNRRDRSCPIEYADLQGISHHQDDKTKDCIPVDIETSNVVRPRHPTHGSRHAIQNSISHIPVDYKQDDNVANNHLDHQISTSIKRVIEHLDVANLVREALSRRVDNSIIDTDGTETEVSCLDEDTNDEKRRSLLMSPALITRRFQQASNAIELRNWDQISYLIKADPWLMEMADLRNHQYLVHVLALFGAGQPYDDDDDDDNDTGTSPAPKQLIHGMIEHDPNVAHRLDSEGNLPLHMAAASGNIVVIRELGLIFRGAASVQNHDGLLPLHLAIMSCALFPSGEQSVELILSLFPGGVCVRDNEGNTPLHTAAGTLKGDIGEDIIYHLMTVCNDLTRENSVNLKESTEGNSMTPKQFEEATILTTTTDPFTDASVLDDLIPGSVFCVAKNNKSDTPLARAIKSLAGWQVVDALLSMSGGHLAVFEKSRASQNALHLVLENEFNDSAVVLAILKAAPSVAPIPDGSGTLPIHLACMNCLQREIILAIAIIDLPIDLGVKEEAVLRNGFGASWRFLICESDDRFVDVITEILAMCSHPQKMALCLTTAGDKGTGKSAVTSATPKCKLALMSSLRFLGRFEFMHSEMKTDASSTSIPQFEVIDFGSHEHEGRKKVSLRCYTNDEEFTTETGHLMASLSENLVEQLDFFSVTELEPHAPHSTLIKHCVAIQIPTMTLSRVVVGMPKDHKYREDAKLLGRYFGKANHILLQTAMALNHLHNLGIVHGFIDSHHIGKFGQKWKVTGLLGSVLQGSNFSSSRLGLHSPPEAFTSPKISLVAVPSVDIWAFGKLMYEVLVGESLFSPFPQGGETHNIISTWNNKHAAIVTDQLFKARIGSAGIDLIMSCLITQQDRLASMTSVLQHHFWKEST